MANKALAVNPSTGAIVAPVSATTFRNANGLQIGLNIQAWSADLDSFVTNASWSGSTVTFAGGLTLAASQALTLGNSATVTTGSGVFWTIGAFNTVALDGTSTITIGGAAVPTISSTSEFSNKTINLSSNTLVATSAQLAAAVTDETGSGALVFATSPTLSSPVLGVATATSLNGLAVTATSGSTLTLSNGVTLAVSNSLTFTGTNGTSFAFPGSSDTVVTLAATQTLSGKTLTAPRFADLGFIADANGNELIVMDTTASAINEITVANAAVGGMPSISATGGDTNISLRLIPKGTGSVQIPDGTSSIPALRGSDADSGISFEPGGSKGMYFIVDGAVIAAYFGNGQVSLQGTEGHLVTGSSRLDPAEPAIFRSGASTTGFYFDSTAGEPGLCYSGTYGLKIASGGDVILQKTITAGGTTGVQVINKTTGSINIEATATSKAVTNSLVTANSIIIAVAATNDSAAAVKNVVAGSGTFTINLTAAANAEMRVNWIVTN